MSFILPKFRVDNLSNGHIKYIKTTNNIQILSESSDFFQLLSKFKKKKKMSTDNIITKYLNQHILIKNNNYPVYPSESNKNVSIYAFLKLRITVLYNTSFFKNSVFYGFAPNNDTPPDKINWSILYANTTANNIGDYHDVDIYDPDCNQLMYLAFLFVPNGWNNKIVYDADKKICMIPEDVFYFSNYKLSTVDNEKSHMIISTIDNYNVVIAFEDEIFSRSDEDYCDLILGLSPVPETMAVFL